jgi:hypothetical protein
MSASRWKDLDEDDRTEYKHMADIAEHWYEEALANYTSWKREERRYEKVDM